MLLKVTQEIITTPGTLYRVGKRLGQDGLWYDKDGNETGLIHKLKEGNAKALPMGQHPIFREDGYHWISTTDTTDMLPMWFSENDMKELIAQDYEVFKIEVIGYRRFHFEGYSHEVFSVHQMLSMDAIDPNIVYPGLKA